MTTILIVVLFFLQLLSFYFLIILNTKLAKFKDLEKKQERLMREMDDTISVYLAEMKDENDRLIQELQSVSMTATKTNAVKQVEQIARQKEQEQSPSLTEEESTVDGSTSVDHEPRIYVPKKIVANAYSRQQQPGVKTEAKVVHSAEQLNEARRKDEVKPITIEQQVIELAKQGKTSEEIAKQLQRGKTEIELLLKFHN